MEKLTTEQLVNKDKNIQDHYRDRLLSGHYSVEQRQHKVEKRGAVFRHQLLLIIEGKEK